MTPRRRTLTRRSLVAAGAGATASHLLATPLLSTAFAAPGKGRVQLGRRSIGVLAPGAVATIALGGPADLIGLSWSAVAGAGPRGLELRFRTPAGAWTHWVAAGGRGHAPEAPPTPGGRAVGEEVWAGGTSLVQLRSGVALDGLVLHTVDVGRGARAAQAGPLARPAGLPLAGPLLQAGPGQPPIIARTAWAAGLAPPRVTPKYGSVQLAFVHHTENPNGYSAADVPAMLLAIYAYHRYVRGWNDIGYNFVVDLYGRTWEARAGGIDLAVAGAQAGGYNEVSSGVAVLGSFMARPPSPRARLALERLLAWKLALHGVPARGRVRVRVSRAGAVYSRYPAGAHVSLHRIAGHRDGDSTDCPGDVLYAELPALRARVARLAPRPVALTLAARPAGGVQPPASAAGSTLGGTLLAGGEPVAGARILLQQLEVRSRGEKVLELTIGEALTAPDGSWLLASGFTPSPRGRILLRAVHPQGEGVPAGVSDVLRVTGTLTPLAPAPTPPAPTPPAA
jgi:hypothetical protein